MSHRLPRAAAIASVLTVALVACSSSDDDGGGASSSDATTAARFNGVIPAGGDAELVGEPGSVADLCPGGFAISAGSNTGFTVTTTGVVDDDGMDEPAAQERRFHVGLPADVTTPRPLLVVFHGADEDGLSTLDGQKFFDEYGMQDFVDAGYIVVAPSSELNGGLWPVWDALRTPGDENAPNRDLDFFDALVSCTAATYPVDATRIYLAGVSAGGSMAHFIARRRSRLLAAMIAGSGTFQLTGSGTGETLSPMAALMTWGGPSDGYKNEQFGECEGQVFDVATAEATHFYEEEPKVAQYNCKPTSTEGVGHRWLTELNGAFIDFLDTHPKGTEDAEWKAPSVDGFACSGDPMRIEGRDDPIECKASAKAGCQRYCELTVECLVDNAPIEPILSCQLDSFGFTGPGHRECGGCVDKCDDLVESDLDVSVAACFGEAPRLCNGDGIQNALPYLLAIQKCCKDDSDAVLLDSALCADFCGTVNSSKEMRAFAPFCAEFPSAL